MSDAERTFTEAEHFALLTDRVARETADLTAERDTIKASLDELQQRVDVLEAEKATAQTERDAAVAEFEEYKAELERAAELATLRDERSAKVTEVTSHLDGYVTAERADRWANMTEEAFDAFLADLTDARPSGAPEKAAEAPRQTAAFSQGSAPTSSTGSVKLLLAGRRGA